MFVVNSIDVEVRDLTDAAMIVSINQTVQDTFSHLVGAGHVQVSASDERGRWDLHIRGRFGHHVARFLAAPDRLAERVERRLRAFLQGVVPPLSTGPRRPALVIRVVQKDRFSRRFTPSPRLSRTLHQKRTKIVSRSSYGDFDRALYDRLNVMLLHLDSVPNAPL